MSNHSKALEFINKLIAKYGKGGYIFRGTTTRYSLQKGEGGILDGINSNLYRWIVKDEKKGEIAAEQQNLKEIFIEDDSFPPSFIERDIVENARKHFPSNTENHEILTELQHFGGKTNMIDFSRNMYVGLFFACHGDFGVNGELIALREKNCDEINKIDYAKLPPKGALEIINPATAQSSRQRVHFQSSVFVRPANGFINPDLCEINKIDKEIKNPLMEYLRTFHNLTANTIYNDLHGFIKNEKNNETFSVYFAIGLANQEKGKYESAIAYYGKCLQIDRNAPAVYNNLGGVYSDMKEYKRAIQNFDKAISIKPDHHEAYNNRGNVYYFLKQLERAIEDYNQSLTFKPDSTQTYINRGNAYAGLKQYLRSIQNFDQALFMNPKNANAYNSRGVSYGYLKQYERAIQDFNQAISLDPNLPVVYNNRGFVYNRLKRHEEAIADLNQAISLKPDYPDAHYNRAKTKEKMGDKKGADEDFAKAKELGYIPNEEEEE